MKEIEEKWNVLKQVNKNVHIRFICKLSSEFELRIQFKCKTKKKIENMNLNFKFKVIVAVSITWSKQRIHLCDLFCFLFYCRFLCILDPYLSIFFRIWIQFSALYKVTLLMHSHLNDFVGFVLFFQHRKIFIFIICCQMLCLLLWLILIENRNFWQKKKSFSLFNRNCQGKNKLFLALLMFQYWMFQT